MKKKQVHSPLERQFIRWYVLVHYSVTATVFSVMAAAVFAVDSNTLLEISWIFAVMTLIAFVFIPELISQGSRELGRHMSRNTFAGKLDEVAYADDVRRDARQYLFDTLRFSPIGIIPTLIWYLFWGMWRKPLFIA